MDKRHNWFWISLSTLWVGGVLWVLTYKFCQDYFGIELQGSIVIAVGLLLVWKLLFHLLGYMLRSETVNRIKILVMSFLCGTAFALYFPMGIELVNPPQQKPPELNTQEEGKPAVQIIPGIPVTPEAPQPQTITPPPPAPQPESKITPAYVPPPAPSRETEKTKEELKPTPEPKPSEDESTVTP